MNKKEKVNKAIELTQELVCVLFSIGDDELFEVYSKSIVILIALARYSRTKESE